MTWGRALENALASKGISKEFKEWIAIANVWRSDWVECHFCIKQLWLYALELAISHHEPGGSGLECACCLHFGLSFAMAIHKFLGN